VLPASNLINMRFLLACVKGEKKLMRSNEVNVARVMRVAELSGKQALTFCEQAPDLKAFVPAEWFKTKRVSRQYLWTVIATYRPDFVKQVQHHAITQRQQLLGEGHEAVQMKVCDDFGKLIQEHPFISVSLYLKIRFNMANLFIQKKKGRIMRLMKKEKEARARKAPRKFPLLGDVAQYDEAMETYRLEAA